MTTRVLDETATDRELKANIPDSASPLEAAVIAAHRVGFSLPENQIRAAIGDDQTPRRVLSAIEGVLLDVGAPGAKATLKAAARALIRSTTPNPSDIGMPRVIRRNGMMVTWDSTRIEVAARLAFISCGLDSSPGEDVARAVTEQIRSRGYGRVDIEQVQDCVQEELMRGGHYRAAEQFILYRAARRSEREAQREAQAAQDTQPGFLMITEDDSTSAFYNPEDLDARIRFALTDLDLQVSPDDLRGHLLRSTVDGITRSDLRDTIILNARTLIETDAGFSKFVGRLLLTYLYEEVLDWSIVEQGIVGLQEAHATALRRLLARGVEIERINPKMLAHFDFSKLAAALDPSADLEFDFIGIQTLADRYLIVDKTRKPARRLETPQLFWMRVAMGHFLTEDPSEATDRAIALYRLYKDRRFCSSTPTLFNSGTPHSQLSSCYLYKVDDSLESIMQRGVAENAFLSKWAGGLGGSWTAVRGTGAYIKGTNGESQGVIPFLKLHNDQLVAVNQGGKRRGSGCAYLESWHNDIPDFLELRRNVGDERRRTHDLNTANWIPDLFMKRMEAREHWTLFRSNETPDLHELYGRRFEERYLHYEKLADEGKIFGQKMPAIELWKSMLKMLIETGHPWITFKDPCNVRSPQDHVGVIHSSNLCTEITLNTSDEETAVCNLGSVILDRHIKDDGSLDMELLRETIAIAVRALDNVIDTNFYPTEAARRANMRHRPIGLGVMGLQNALYKKGLSFASTEAIEFNDEFMEAIAFFAYSASSDLAAERGRYESYAGSKWDRGILPQDTIDMLETERGVPVTVPRGGRLDWAEVREKIRTQGMRNSNVIAIAPTATIANIMGTTPCIEPHYKNLFVKENLGGAFTVINENLVKDLKAAGLWSKEMAEQLKYYDGELDAIDSIPDDIRRKHLTVFRIPPEYIIDAAARRQKWIDQSQSVNLWLENPDLKVASHMYRRAWHSGLKTTYYLRTTGASSIEKATIATRKEVRHVAAKPEYNEAQKRACSIEAMRRGEECEACQ
jgi:ribonucleoside-diphosphate reductase, alpha subunit